MTRNALFVLAASILTFQSIVSADEHQPHRKWMAYFHGTWTFENQDGEQAEVTFDYVPGKYAMVGKRPTNPGGIQLVGWQPDRGVMVDTEYDGDGSYSEIEYSEFGETQMKGKFIHYTTPEEDFAGALITVTIESDDVASAVVKGTGKSGKTLNRKTFFHRKK